jgi:hypothetical protein
MASTGVLAGGLMVAPAQAATVPSCVARGASVGIITTTAYATNGCGNARTFYFLWDRHVDGPCTTLQNGYTRTEKVAVTARFAGLSTC